MVDEEFNEEEYRKKIKDGFEGKNYKGAELEALAKKNPHIHKNSLANLVPLHKIDPQIAGLIRKRSGSRDCYSTEKKRWAMRLSILKRKGLTDNTAQLLADMIQEKESLALEVLTILLSAKNLCNNAADKIKLANALSSIMKSLHGDKTVDLPTIQNNMLNSVTINITPTEGNKSIGGEKFDVKN